MSQQIQINYGAAPNDGQGDPLRTAFIKTDENFDNIWSAGPVGSNITITNNTISVVDTNGNLILSPNGIGAIQTNNRLLPRATLTYDIGSPALRYRNVYAVGVDVANAVLGNLSTVSITVANLHVLGGTDGDYLQTDGAGNLSWAAGGGSGNGEVGGANTQVQFNDDGNFGGQSGFTFDKTSNVLSIPGNLTLSYSSFTANLSVTMTNIGSVAYNSASPLSSGGSLEFVGDESNHFLVVPNEARFAPGTGDFTIEWYQYVTSDGHAWPRPFSLGVCCSNINSLLVGLFEGESDIIAIQVESGYNPFSGWTNTLDVWQHIAVVRSSGTVSIYQDGVEFNSVSIPDSIDYDPTNGYFLSIGSPTADGTTGDETINSQYVGLITNMRYVVGTAVYTGNFTPSTDPLTLITGTELLLPVTDSGTLAEALYIGTVANNSSIISNGNAWTFGGDGALSLPNAQDQTNSQIYTTNGGDQTVFETFNTNDGQGAGQKLTLDYDAAEVKIQTQAGTEWTFGQDGSTTFPTLTTQRGDNPSGTITGQTLLFGDATQEAVISTPDGTSGNEYSQRLVINPGAGNNYGEGGDIYLWAGRGGDGSGSGGDIKIRGGQGGANTTGGSGGAGGYIRMEAGDAAVDGQAGYIEITGGYGNVQGGDVTITGGYGGSGGNVLLSSGGYTWTVGHNSKITLPFGASLNDTSGDSVAFGQNAGATSQDRHAVAVGGYAGSQYQGEDSIAIGYQAGNHDQQRGVAIGYQAGYGGTLYKSVNTFNGGSGPVTTYYPWQAPDSSRLYVASTTNIETNQRVFGNNIQTNTVVTAVYPGEDRVDISPNYTAAMSEGDTLTFVSNVIGLDNVTNVVYGMRVTGTDIPVNTFVQSTGSSVVVLNQYPTAPLVEPAGLQFEIGQGQYATAVGFRAGQNFQGDAAVAIGYGAGGTNQNIQTVAVGSYAGNYSQGNNSVAIGSQAGQGQQSANAVAVGGYAGTTTQGLNAVAVGFKAGNYQQGPRAVAIGEDAGFNSQGEDAVAVGQKAGFSSQGDFAVAIGNTAGTSGQQTRAIAIGYGTGLVSQQYSAVAIGANAASYNQGDSAVAIGRLAGNTSQGAQAQAIGDYAGYNLQNYQAVAVGSYAGQNFQSAYAVAIGSEAGRSAFNYSALYQSGSGTEITITPNASIKIGQRITGDYVPADTYVANIDGASLTLSQAITGTPAVDTNWTVWAQQGTAAVAIGRQAGGQFQGNAAVAIGREAGYESQGANSIAIGSFAGQSAQGNNSIILNATGANLNQTTANTFTVAPIRASTLNNYSADTGNVLYYNTSTHEITAAPPNNIAGDPLAAASLDSTANVTVWTASSDQVVGAKMTVRVVYYTYDTSDWQNTEMLDIMMAKTYPAGTPAFTVTNRIKTNNAYTSVPIDVTLTGANVIQVISSAPDGVGNNVYWTYSVTAFNQTFD